VCSLWSEARAANLHHTLHAGHAIAASAHMMLSDCSCGRRCSAWANAVMSAVHTWASLEQMTYAHIQMWELGNRRLPDRQ
jgi:hypothetical protein